MPHPLSINRHPPADKVKNLPPRPTPPLLPESSRLQQSQSALLPRPLEIEGVELALVIVPVFLQG